MPSKLIMSKSINEKCKGEEHVLFEGAKKCQCGELSKDEIIALRGCVGDEHVTVAGKARCECGEFRTSELEEVDEDEGSTKVSNWTLFAIGVALMIPYYLSGNIVLAIVSICGSILALVSIVSGIANHLRSDH